LEKVLSFFRVFDLAFFAPGAILFWVLHTRSLLGEFDPLTREDLSLGELGGAFAGIVTLVFIYLIGICVHSLRENLPHRNSAVEAKVSEALGTPWYLRIEPPARAELGSYFWYMRATCANIAVVFVIAAPIMLLPEPNGSADAGFGAEDAVLPLIFVMAAVVVWRLSSAYDRALRRLTSVAPANAR
jgi:hypothetical protein